MKIDLHTHSRNSDGSDTPTELIEAAIKAGLDLVALTDHDTIAGWDEAAEAASMCKIKFVRGVEFSTSNEGHGQHLLGYDLDPDHEAVAEILSKGAESREGRVDKIFKVLEELKMPVDSEYVKELAGGIPSRKHFAKAMHEAKHVKSEDEAFALYLNEGGPAYIKRYRPTIEETIRAIDDAGGASVIAHPHDGKRGPVVNEGRFAELKEVGLRGIEVDHQQHSPKVRDALRAIAKNLDLTATGASDYHGDRKIDHDLGCNTTAVAALEELLQKSVDEI